MRIASFNAENLFQRPRTCLWEDLSYQPVFDP
jgi:hypothetical protein